MGKSKSTGQTKCDARLVAHLCAAVIGHFHDFLCAMALVADSPDTDLIVCACGLLVREGSVSASVFHGAAASNHRAGPSKAHPEASGPNATRVSKNLPRSTKSESDSIGEWRWKYVCMHNISAVIYWLVFPLVTRRTRVQFPAAEFLH